MYLFFAQVPAWTVLVGGALCLIGGFVMITEESDDIESLRTTEGETQYMESLRGE